MTTSSHDHYKTACRLRDAILTRRFASLFTAVETATEWQTIVDECNKASSALHVEMGTRVHGRSQHSFLDLVDMVRGPAMGQVNQLAGR